MPRKGAVPKRDVLPDPVYNSKTVTRFINKIMLSGKKSVAQGIVYAAFDAMAAKTGKDPLELFETALKNVMPVLEVRARRVPRQHRSLRSLPPPLGGAVQGGQPDPRPDRGDLRQGVHRLPPAALAGMLHGRLLRGVDPEEPDPGQLVRDLVADHERVAVDDAGDASGLPRLHRVPLTRCGRRRAEGSEHDGRPRRRDGDQARQSGPPPTLEPHSDHCAA